MDNNQDINKLIAQRVKRLRAEKGLSLEELSNVSGVSRSMLSLIERAESSPTALVLDKIASAFGVSLAMLFDVEPNPLSDPISRAEEQSTWTDPASGYSRKIISPQTWPSPLRLSQICLPPKAHINYASGYSTRKIHQQILMQHGSLELHIGSTCYALKKGDCLAMILGEETTFINPEKIPSEYLVVQVYE